MKKVMSESEMEVYLIKNGFNIYNRDRCIDSTKTTECAIGLGYEIKVNKKTQTLEFMSK